MLRYKHWFWDFDGTLYDTYPSVVRAFQRALVEKDIYLTDDDVFKLVKNKLDAAAASVAGGQYKDELIKLYHFYAHDEGLDILQPYPGLEAVLSCISGLGGHHYLYTHRGATARQALERDGLLQLFTDAVTGLDNFPSKPAPDALLYMMHKNNLNPEECVMVGDRPIDLDAGKNAGISYILFDADMAYPNYPVLRRFTGFDQMLSSLEQGNL